MERKFTCSICETSHEGAPKDWGFTLPDAVWEAPETEREGRAKYTSDLCQFDDRYFIRGLLKLPFQNTADYFGWGVWAEVKQDVFQRYLDLYDCDATGEPPNTGKIANALPGCQNSLNALTVVKFQTATERPFLEFPETDTSALAQDQRQGIDQDGYHKILVAIGTPL